MQELQYTKVLKNDSSFQLVRTNPKLTGNVKIAVNEKGDMYLNSIKANLELSNDDYSKFPLDPNLSHAANLFYFFRSGTTPNEIIFDLNTQVDLYKTSKNFKDQYDFSYYFSGAKYLASNKYEERMSYFAPIYLKKEIPNYFVVFKIEDPLNDIVSEVKAAYDAGDDRGQYMIDFFKKATIIKTFDLRPETKVGKYIRTYVEDINFPISPLTVSFEEDDLTTWNGILVKDGVFGKKGEYLYDFYQSSYPLKFFEENITNGFSRNGVIFPNILNLEFVFNDDSSKKYDLNRYFGMYVNSLEVTRLELDMRRAYLERSSWENTPVPNREYLETDEVALIQENVNGVQFTYKGSEHYLSEFNESFTDVNKIYFNYLQDKDGGLHLLNTTPDFLPDYSEERLASLSYSALTNIVTASVDSHGYSTGDIVVINSVDVSYAGEFSIQVIDSDSFTYLIAGASLPTAQGTSKKELKSGKLRLSDKKVDMGLFFGQSRSLFLQDEGFTTTVAGHSHLVIKLTLNPSDLDEIRLYHPRGTRKDLNGKYELIVATSNYSLVPTSKDFYAYNDFDEIVGNDVFYFNSTGYLNEVAIALTGCINGIRNRQFTAYSYKEYVFIKLNIPGDFDALHKLNFSSPSNNYSPFTVNQISDIQNKFIPFEGGSLERGNRLIIDAGHLEKIQQNLKDVLIKTSNGWSKIKKVSKYIDLISEENLSSPQTIDSALGDYLEKIAIVLEEKETPTVRYAQFTMRLKFKPSFGLISIFPIKDLDFDFYASEYTNFPEIDLYNYYFIPPGANLLLAGKKYEVLGSGVIEINGTQYSAGTSILAVTDSKYTIVSGNPLVTYYTDYTTVGEFRTTPINDENNELKDFQGFSILKDPSKVVQQSATIEYQLKTKFLNGLTSTEYDYYKENDSLDFAVRSKILPYINKWGILDGKDSRDNQYRLNTELVFGRNNFSPDHEDRTQNPLNFTHEWFYIESVFNYIKDPISIKLNYNYFENPLDENLLLSDPDYFINYFTYTPNYNGKEFSQTQIRYSNVLRNKAGVYETFFKGFKLSFKDYLDPSFLGEDNKPQPSFSNRFDGYRFSALLKVVPEDINDKSQVPVKYRVIEHKDYKFIVLIIELALGSINEIEDYWKKVNAVEPISNIDVTNFLDPTYSSILTGKLPFESVDGEYRIAFNQDLVSNLNNTFLYAIKSKKFNNLLNRFSTVKVNKNLSFQLNGPSGVDSAAGTIKSFANSSTLNYSGGLSDDVTSFTDVNFITIKDTSSGSNFFMTSLNGFVPVVKNPVTGAFTEFLTYDNTQNLCLITTSGAPPYYSFSSVLPSGSNLIVDRFYAFKVLTGGEKYFEKIFQKLSFGNFKRYVNSLDPMIEYYSYSLGSNGNSVLADQPLFYFEVIDQNIITKVNQVIYQTTPQVPNQFSGQSSIGYEYEQVSLNLKYALNRYKGEYEPLTTTVLSCNSTFYFSKNNILPLSLANILINPEIEKNLSIRNFNHIKVADSKILDLESDSTYLAKYPTIDEVAINHAEYFLLRGNWDWGFHYRYSNKSKFTPVSGALRVEEDECFVSKLLTLPETIELQNFTVLILGKDQELKDTDLDQIEIVVKEGQFLVEGYINLNTVLTRYFIEDGISQKFSSFLSNSNTYIGNYLTIQQYVEDYIKQNVLKLYEVSTNEFFTKNVTNIVSAVGASNINSISFYFLDDKERFRQGYSLNRALQINNTSRLILKFSFNKKPGSGLAVSPKITVKFN